MKTHVITFAKQFMKGHPKEGKPTNFRERIMKAEKIHTIRANYDYWAPKVQQVIDGEARLSLRYWKGKPYRSKQQKQFWEVTHVHKPEYQRFQMTTKGHIIIDGVSSFNLQEVAENDGLLTNDFLDWFEPHKKPFNGIIIHFTDFRY